MEEEAEISAPSSKWRRSRRVSISAKPATRLVVVTKAGTIAPYKEIKRMNELRE